MNSFPFHVNVPLTFSRLLAISVEDTCDLFCFEIKLDISFKSSLPSENI